MDKKGGITFLGSKKFCLTVLKMFVGGTLLSFEKNMVMKRFMHRCGGASRFVRNFCLTVPQIFVGGDLCVFETSGMEKTTYG